MSRRAGHEGRGHLRDREARGQQPVGLRAEDDDVLRRRPPVDAASGGRGRSRPRDRAAGRAGRRRRARWNSDRRRLRYHFVMTLSLHGIFAPLTTPFVANGDIDPNAFTNNIKAHLDAGLSGVVVGGSTGEAALLDEAERSSLVEVARDATPRSKMLI